jgi:SAM-dependent methyltransferase
MRMDQHKWNELADGFDEGVFNIARTDLTGMVARYVKSVPASPGSSVLVDLGCGTGSFIRKFGHRFHEIVGVEFAARIIARAKRSLGTSGKIDWLTMDIGQAAKVIGPRADLTTCLNVVTSPSAAQRRRLWTSIARTLKPRGYALIVVPSFESEMMVHELGGTAKPSKTGIVRIDDDASQKFYRRDELIADLARHGLKTRKIGRVFYPWAEEGMRKPRGSGRSYPWGWICLAQRAA